MNARGSVVREEGKIIAARAEAAESLEEFLYWEGVHAGQLTSRVL